MLHTIYRVECDGPGERGFVCGNKVESTWSSRQARRTAKALGWNVVRGGLFGVATHVCPECLTRLRGQDLDEHADQALKVVGGES